MVGKLPKEAATIVANQEQGRAIAGVPEPDRVKVLETASKKAESEGREMTAADIKAQWDAANPLHQPLQRLIILRFQFLRSGG